MTTDELMEKLKAERVHNESQNGARLLASKNGPVGAEIIADIVEVLAAIEARVKALEDAK